MKRYESNYNPAVKDISDYIHNNARNFGIDPVMATKIKNVLDGVEVTDNLLVQKDNVINQKTTEVQNTKQVLFQKEQLLVQKEQTIDQLRKNGVVDVRQEFIDSLHKLYPDSYPANFGEWSDNLPMKKYVVNNDVQAMEKNTAIYKQWLAEKEPENIKKEFIKSLNELYPDSYSTDPSKWFYKDGKPLPMKVHYDKNNFEVMKKNIKFYKKQLEEKQVKALEEVKILKEENLKKEKLLVQKDELLLAKELEKKELLAQQEKEIHNKSLAKNKVINELEEDIGLKEKEALNLKIESLMKRLEFHKKESEFKDRALEDALEIGKQKDIVNELQGKLLAFKNLSKHDETLQLELSVIHFKVEESILSGNVDEMKELSKYLSQLMKNPIEKEESLDISELLNNLSPVLHVQENLVQNPLAVINNFDINNVHTTHSVLISMSGEDSFSIIQEDGSH
jgi:hypothetical protein